MSVDDNLDDYNKVRTQLQDVEGGWIPTNPSKDLLDAFMGLHHFSLSYDERRFDILLIDNKDRKVYAYPQSKSIRDEKPWALIMIRHIVSLRNIKETYWKEKDHRKRRKIFSKMNSIKGELNRYELS